MWQRRATEEQQKEGGERSSFVPLCTQICPNLLDRERVKVPDSNPTSSSMNSLDGLSQSSSSLSLSHWPTIQGCFKEDNKVKYLKHYEHLKRLYLDEFCKN